ncbi:MAG: tetratricopeptide repeat protein [Elusimicrobiota bacterium]
MNRRKTALLILLLAAITFISYLPSLKNDFVNYDDNVMVTGNRDIRDLSPQNVFRIFSKPHAGLYHPLVTLSYAVEYRIAGLNPRLFHATNLLLHILNSILVFAMIILLTSNPAVSFVVAAMFGLHPMHVESVAWIAERKDVLYAFFFLLSIVCYQAYAKKTGKKWYALSVTAFMLSLLSKPMAVTLPVIIFLLDYYEGRKFNTKSVYEKAPFIVLSAAFSAVAIIFHRASGWTGEITAGSLVSGVYRAFNGLLFYLSKIFAPVKLVHTYVDSEMLSQWFGVFDLSLILIITAVFIILLGRDKWRKTALFGAAFFVTAILPALQIITNGRAIAADRYTYVPSIGIFFIVASVLYYFAMKNIKTMRIAAGMFIVLTAGMSFMTWQRCEVWRDGVSLWADELKQYPKFVYALNNRGLAYGEKGRFDLAFDDFQKAIQLDPGFVHAYNNRANIYKRRKEIRKAFADYDKTVELNGAYQEAYLNRGSLFEDTGRYEKAVFDYSKVIELDPNNALAHYNRGNVYAVRKEYEKALADYNSAINIEPFYADAYMNRGSVYMKRGDFEKAGADFDKAISADPSAAEAYYNRGVLNFQAGRSELALFDFSKATQLDPGMAKAYFNRGMTYRLIGNLNDAEKDLKKAEELGLKR